MEYSDYESIFTRAVRLFIRNMAAGEFIGSGGHYPSTSVAADEVFFISEDDLFSNHHY